jgi:NADPH:quinone reductase
VSDTSMPAVVIRKTDGGDGWNRLTLDRVARPQPAAGEVLIQVEACSVNQADLLQRRGLYPPPVGASSLLGLDFAGFVVETVADGTAWHAGDRVFGVVAGGGYGRYVAVCAEHLVPVPDNLSFVEAAAAAEVFSVAFLNLFLEANLQPGESLLVHGGGGGVGTAAIQLARATGVRVYITAGSAEKVKRCLELGAHYGIDYNLEDFAARIFEISAGEGIDVILDWIGAPYLGRHLQILKNRGRLMLIGLLGGNQGEVQLAPLLTKRLHIMGSVLRSRSQEEKAALTRAFRDRVLPLLGSGEVRPIVDRIYPIQEVEAAHQYLRQRQHFGKIVLTWHTSNR